MHLLHLLLLVYPQIPSLGVLPDEIKSVYVSYPAQLVPANIFKKKTHKKKRNKREEKKI